MKTIGNQTKLAIENFGIGSLDRDFIAAYGDVKKAAIVSLYKVTDKLSEEEYTAIINSIDSLIQGKFDDLIVTGFKQGGAGTSINMNINEVIALTASQKAGFEIDPIEKVNLFQSTNDTFTTALTIMAYRHLSRVEDKIVKLQEALITKENEYSSIVMTGRTEMQAALPITLGQVFGSFAGPVERDRWRLNKLKERIRTIALGGTAIGTGFGASINYSFEAEKQLRNSTGLPLCRSQNLPDEISNADKYAELANGYKLIALSIVKIAGDLLFYTSSDIDEIDPTELQYGSSIMAAKRNPVILEFIRGLAFNIQGECFKIDLYVQNGQLQLNPYLPFLTESLITIYHDLVKLIDAFLSKFINIIQINTKKIEENCINSKIIFNCLLPLIGYNKAKELYKKSKESNLTSLVEIKNFIKNETNIPDEDIKKVFNP
ncbi:MAG: hypothetical protein A2015_15855 [Spirochaetes bacterium GWF1_31_7]|nr:MAG: hypothetical protein A2Y30_13230 [Spirochaetes bacterium GWE1_32_154]OHD49928.1 MAG: hypothetical protein A2Y29_11275 [Spirochaetes bacterium GWE2_31_10]OHD52246.1 MAG: hypothetical protein A2015_15855 [Spirochaetes bacterium GWF1_31_7]OHD82284.1 MAG: hypothetical protein A2355_00845 [Spirochaetes bacterium RIFOXYB1_FULL_32_8]HBD92615.1 fumarate lyase [Spirochaetia bacterium]